MEINGGRGTRRARPPARRNVDAGMRAAHRLSRKYNIDPAYSADRVRPSPRGLSLFSSKDAGPFWLYGWADLEAYLLSRVRKEGFLGCYEVLHPGLFNKFSHILLFRKNFHLKSPPEDAKVVMYHSGDLRLKVNGRIGLHVQATAHPAKRTLDLGRFLKRGKNEIYITLNRIDEPPAFLMDGSFLQTDADWSAGRDHYHWSRPACLPFEGSKRFPHQERLPHLLVQKCATSGDVRDYGAGILGRPLITLSSRKGRVTIHAGESLAEVRDTTPDHREQFIQPVSSGRGKYTTNGEVAFRYLRVLPSRGAEAKRVAVSASFYPTRYRGAFACADEELNRIWMHSAYTLRLCMREFLIDGIKRDRMPWLGDVYVALLSNVFSFAEKEVVKRTLTALYGERPEESHFNGIIEYTLFWVMILDEYLLYFGDEEYVARVRPQFLSLMEILESKENRDGFLVADEFTWLLIDWAYIEKSGVVAALQMLYVMALQSAARLGHAFRDEKRAAYFSGRARRLQRLCRRFFWNDAAGAFADNVFNGKQSRHITRHANFLGILSGAATGKQTRRILSNVLLQSKVAPVGTPYMKFFECLALARCGKHGEMTQGVKDYWGGMLKEGATTFWEAYDPAQSGNEHYGFYGRPFGKSLCHAWASGPIHLLSGELLGARPTEAGWKRFRVLPHPGNLRWLCASIPTPLGDVEVEVEGSRVSVRAPDGAVMEKSWPETSIRARK